MNDFFQKYKWRLAIGFFLPLLTSYFVFAFNGFIPAGEVGKASWLSFWGGYLAFFGTVFLGLVTVWQTNRANEQASEAHKTNLKLLSIEEHSRSPYLEIMRDSCNIEIISDKKIKIKIHTRNISNFPVHNIKLSLGTLSDEEIRLSYIPDNFHSWMIKLAKISYADIKKSPDNIDFVTSMSESVVRKRVRYIKGQRHEEIYDRYSDSQSFYLNYEFVEDMDYKIPIKIFMENVTGKLYKQTTNLYILKNTDTDGSFYVFNHSTKVELMEDASPCQLSASSR